MTYDPFVQKERLHSLVWEGGYALFYSEEESKTMEGRDRGKEESEKTKNRNLGG